MNKFVKRTVEKGGKERTILLNTEKITMIRYSEGDDFICVDMDDNQTYKFSFENESEMKAIKEIHAALGLEIPNEYKKAPEQPFNDSNYVAKNIFGGSRKSEKEKKVLQKQYLESGIFGGITNPIRGLESDFKSEIISKMVDESLEARENFIKNILDQYKAELQPKIDEIKKLLDEANYQRAMVYVESDWSRETFENNKNLRNTMLKLIKAVNDLLRGQE